MAVAIARFPELAQIHARLARAEDDLPGERVAATKTRQHGRVEAERAVGRRVHDLRRQDHRDVREHRELRAEPAELLDELGDRAALAAEALVAEER